MISNKFNPKNHIFFDICKCFKWDQRIINMWGQSWSKGGASILSSLCLSRSGARLAGAHNKNLIITQNMKQYFVKPGENHVSLFLGSSQILTMDSKVDTLVPSNQSQSLCFTCVFSFLQTLLIFARISQSQCPFQLILWRYVMAIGSCGLPQQGGKAVQY